LEIPIVTNLFIMTAVKKQYPKDWSGYEFETLQTLCQKAGIHCRVEGPSAKIAVSIESGLRCHEDWCAPDHEGELPPPYRVYRISLDHVKMRDPSEWALRMIEVLAYGFLDYASRETVCHRGYFKKDTQLQTADWPAPGEWA